MSAQPLLVALTSTASNNEISPSELGQVAAALQRQGDEDLRKSWTHAHATVQACPDPNRIPFGYSKITIEDQIDAPGALGYHSDANGQPYSVVQFDGQWPLTASHEFCEMACDPWGQRMYRAPSPDPAADPSQVVQILLELCDPCEGAQYAYRINGVTVSDFITHQYGNGKVGPYSHTNSISAPRQVLPDGYISWVEPDGVTWKQLTNFGAPSVRTLGNSSGRFGLALREWIDSLTRAYKAEVEAAKTAEPGNAS